MARLTKFHRQHPPRYKKKTDSGFYSNTQLSRPTLWILTLEGSATCF
jgi:hypothetical protein